MTLSDAVWMVRLGFALLLAVSVILKVRQPVAVRLFLARLGVPSALAVPASWALSAAEALTVVLLVIGPSFVAGAALAMLFLGFTYAVVRSARLPGGQPCCGCFGSLRQPDTSLFWPVAARAAGAAMGLIVIAAGSQVAPRPSMRAYVGTAALSMVGAALFRRRARIATPADGPGQPEHSCDPRAVGRRAFLSRTLAVAGFAAAGPALLPIARGFACSVCGGGESASMSAMAAEGGSGDGSPCMTAASEMRVTCDSKATDELESGCAVSGNDDGRLLLCADTFRARLIKCNSAFQDAAAAC